MKSTIIRKHEGKMSNIEYFTRRRNLSFDNKPIEESGVKWDGGSITLRILMNENVAFVFIEIGGEANSIEINYYDNEREDFITPNKKIIKELFNETEYNYLRHSNYVW